MGTDTSTALAELSAAGISIWLDDISRDRLNTGNLANLVANKHVVARARTSYDVRHIRPTSAADPAR